MGRSYGPATLIKAGIELIKPILIEQNPLHIEKLWQIILLRSFDYAREGIFLSALSAIDIALWDIKGKFLKQPVSVLLGGRNREKVKVYATGLYFTHTKNLAEVLAEEALGYHAFSLREAIELSRKLEKYNISWFEEPVSPNEYWSYKELRNKTYIPVAGGECEYLRSGVLQLFQNTSLEP